MTIQRWETDAVLFADPAGRVMKSDDVIREIDRLERRIDEYKKALIWCSGSADFGIGGQAHEGWKKIKHLLK